MAKEKTAAREAQTQATEPTQKELKLTEGEFQSLLNIQLSREKLDLAQENLFLKVAIRLKMDLNGWGVDMSTRKLRPPPEKPAT